jgi:hypothetical protein
VANPVTDVNVYLMTSSDGRHWHGPFTVSRARGDQWFPWVDVNPVTGKVGVLYHDCSYGDPALYDTTLAEGRPGSFRHTKVSIEPSHPRDSIFFQAGVAGCEKCVTFIGDYIGPGLRPRGPRQPGLDRYARVPDDRGRLRIRAAHRLRPALTRATRRRGGPRGLLSPVRSDWCYQCTERGKASPCLVRNLRLRFIP